MRLLWVAPLTVVVAVVVNVAIKTIATTLDPSLSRMPQLQEPLIALTIEGAVAAVVVFALMAASVPRPIYWYRVLAPLALLVSVVPDVLLGIGGSNAGLAMRLMGPFLRLGGAGGPPSGARGLPPGARPPGGGFPAGGLAGLPPEQVGVLALLHAATFLVCVVLLTTLTRSQAPKAVAHDAHANPGSGSVS